MLPDYIVFLSVATVSELFLRCVYTLLLFVPMLIFSLLLGQRRPYLQLTLWSLVLIRALLSTGFSLPFSIRELIGPLGGAPLANMAGSVKCVISSLCLDIPLLIPGVSNRLSLTLIAFTWVCGAIWMLCRFIVDRRFYGAIIDAAPVAAQPELVRVVEQWRGMLGVRRRVELRIGDAMSPFTKGIWRPRIYLPCEVAQDTAVSDVVIGHEMAHIKRFDDLWICVCGMANVLFFFFPPVRYALKQIDLQRERVCDQLVVVHGNVDAREYARHLLAACNGAWVGGRSVPGLSARAAIYSSRIAAIAEASSLGIRGVPLALLLFAAVLVFVMPMAPNLPANPPMLAPGQTGGKFDAPLVHYQIGPRFGTVQDVPGLGTRYVHSGLDLLAPAGSPIVAMADGAVVRRVMRSQTGNNGSYGNYLLVRHGEYLVSYTDLARPQVAAGARVRQGQVLGYLDGIRSHPLHKKPRLHLEIVKDGMSVDPLPLLASGTRR